jgi:hypothetical protein
MQIVPSLKLCTRLKELGYPQEDILYYWVENYYREVGLPKKSDWVLSYRGIVYKEMPKVAAPTVEEMAEWLKVQKIDGEYFLTELYNRFMEWACSIRVWVNYDPMQTFHADTLSNAVAKACIWVLEQRAE